jgi:hypothetical protein
MDGDWIFFVPVDFFEMAFFFDSVVAIGVLGGVSQNGSFSVRIGVLGGGVS